VLRVVIELISESLHAAWRFNHVLAQPRDDRLRLLERALGRRLDGRTVPVKPGVSGGAFRQFGGGQGLAEPVWRKEIARDEPRGFALGLSPLLPGCSFFGSGC